MPFLNLPADPPLASWPAAGTLAILDTEYTAWQGSSARRWQEPWEWREIVQIGMVLVDPSRHFECVESCEVLVRPARNPKLSDYFVKLTGIDQNRVDAEGVGFEQALAAVTPFGTRADLIVFNGADGEVLRENCSFHGLEMPWPMNRMLDFRPLLARTLGRAPQELTSCELPALAGIHVEGRVHSALHDCRAIAAAFGAWRRQGIL